MSARRYFEPRPAELAPKSSLFVGEFHPDIVFMADVDEQWTGQRMI
jgi:hypothetical protein